MDSADLHNGRPTPETSSAPERPGDGPHPDFTAHPWVCVRCRRCFRGAERGCTKGRCRLIQDLRGVQLSDEITLERLLGLGGMGASVWRAWHARRGERVAVKLLPITDSERVAAFRREAEIALVLRHPDVVGAIELGETHAGWHFIVMEYLEGGPLTRELRNGPLPPAAALDLADQVLSALEHIHVSGYVHLDVKPGNVLVSATAEGVPSRVKLADFGLAERHDPAGWMRPAGTVILGTPAFLAPEIIRGRVPDERADVYAAGGLLYNMLTGVEPFRGVSKGEILASVRKQPPSSFAEVAPNVDVPIEIEWLVMRAMAKAPADRPATAREMRSELAHLAARNTPPQPAAATSAPEEEPVPVEEDVVDEASPVVWQLKGTLMSNNRGR